MNRKFLEFAKIMVNIGSKNPLESNSIKAIVIESLEEMTADWDLDFTDGITLKTRLIEDLAFESVDIVQMVVLLEQQLNRKDIPFEKLFLHEGDYVNEIRVAEIVDFLKKYLKL